MDSPPTFTAFAFALHGIEGVGHACVHLQDRFHVDVDLVLFSAYVAQHRQHVLTVDDVATLVERTRPWQREIVAPLRLLRRRLKSGPAPAPDRASNELRERVKAIELEAERIEIENLSEQAANFPKQWTGETSRNAIIASIDAVIVGRGRSERGLSVSPRDRAAVNTIADATSALIV